MNSPKPALWIFGLVLALLLSVVQPAMAGDTADNNDRPFKNFEGCFLLYDLDQQAYLAKNNEKMVSKRFSPCSTFKVPHALIGLDLEILRGGSTLFKWDGKPMYFPVWEKDHTLNSAMANSVVWYFQKLAKRIGSSRMAEYLTKFDYGNQDISGGQDRFWLMSSLKISPLEQIGFLKKLVQEDLPVSQRAMDLTKQAVMQGKQGEAKLYGKTGSGSVKGKFSQGWFVGWVEPPGRTLLFVTYIKAPQGASGGKAKAFTLAKLKHLGLWQTPLK